MCLLGTKIGIDFGSSSFTVFVEGKGIVMREPSVMVCDKFSGQPVAIGSTAKQMSEKLPGSMYAVYPIKDGIVIDPQQACVMLKNCLNKICFGKLFKPNVLMSVPGTVTPLQRKTVFDVVMSSGAGKACFVDEALASAIGAGVSLTEPMGTMICDIGGGITDCAVVTMGNIAASESLKLGGNDLSKAIVEYVAKKHKTLISLSVAEEIKNTVGGAIPRTVEIGIIVCGKNTGTGLPVETELTASEIFEVCRPITEEMLSCIVRVFENTSPELCADISDKGIILCGGSARLYGLDKFIERRTGIKTVVAENPDECAAAGMGILLKDMKYLDRNGYVFKTVSETDEGGE